jgi:hypothetical protein
MYNAASETLADEEVPFMRIRPSQVLIIFLIQTAFALAAYAADLKAEDLIAHHLDSIGTADARAAAKSRAVQGKLVFKVLVGGGGTVDGSWGRVSEQRKSNFVMRFGLGDYRGEQFVYDNNKTYIAAETASHQKSAFGRFVQTHDYIIKEGLLGGELSTGWALMSLDDNHPKLLNAGLKKVDGKQLYDLEYHPKHNDHLQNHIYFDPETYRHVKTVYSMAVIPNMGPSITSSASQYEIRYTIEERFGDFKTDNGITLPSTYSLEYTQETQSGRTTVLHWDMTATQVADNVGLDPKNFDTH